MQKFRMYIDGRWVDAASGKTFTTVNPATNEDYAEVPLAGPDDVDRAVAAARAAFPGWAAKTQDERSDIVAGIGDAMRTHIEEFAMLDALEHGLPVHLAEGPASAACVNMDTAAALARSIFGDVCPGNETTLYCLTRVPVGVCALITPWNLPLFLMAQKVALSIVTGNTCVLKPPSVNSRIAVRFMEVLCEVEDLPKGVVNMITGPGGSIGNCLAEHPDVDCVGFTDSTETGIAIMKAAAPTLKKLIMELGGKNPAIIMPDANLDHAAEVLGGHQFFNCGQACGSPGRYYVHENVYDAFLEKLTARAKEQVVGDPLDPKTTMGPLVSKAHCRHVTDLIKSGIDEGATLVCGGYKIEEPPLDKGNFVAPTIFTDVTPNMRIYREEIFGPVAVVSKFSSEDEVIRLANDNTFGLTASIWTRNIAHALKRSRDLTVGTFSINSHNHVSPNAPWGGVRQSGVGGKEGGKQGILEYTEQKMITICLREK